MSADLYQKAWNPREYLRQYYSGDSISDDEQAVFAQLAEWFQEHGRVFDLALEFGCGPTLHHAAALIPHVKELHLADYLPENLNEIRLWLQDDPSSHNWDVYLKGILQNCESGEGGGEIGKSP